MNNLLETLTRTQQDCKGLFRHHCTERWLPAFKKESFITVIWIDEMLSINPNIYPEYKGHYIPFPDGKSLYDMLSTPREMEEFKKQLKSI